MKPIEKKSRKKWNKKKMKTRSFFFFAFHLFPPNDVRVRNVFPHKTKFSIQKSNEIKKELKVVFSKKKKEKSCYTFIRLFNFLFAKSEDVSKYFLAVFGFQVYAILQKNNWNNSKEVLYCFYSKSLCEAWCIEIKHW